MLARGNQNFRVPGENRTRDLPNSSSDVLTTDPTMLTRGTKILVAPGEHSFSLFQEENIPRSICMLLTSPLININ